MRLNHVKELIAEVSEILSQPRSGSIVTRDGVCFFEADKFLVVGDLHGDLESYRSILKLSGIKKRMDNEDCYVVFLGDYIDRGPSQLELIMEILKLKLRYAEKVILLRGNHEPPRNLMPYPHDFPYVLREKFGENAEELYEIFLELFDLMPYAALASRRILFVHGGPPISTLNTNSLDEYFGLGANKQKILYEVLWSDPYDTELIEPSPRGAGYLYGIKITKSALAKTGAKIIVRGHEPVDGYKLDHNGLVVTLFSRKGPPYFNQRASFLQVDTSVENWHKKIESFIINF